MAATPPSGASNADDKFWEGVFSIIRTILVLGFLAFVLAKGYATAPMESAKKLLGIKLWSWEFWLAALAVTMLLIAIWDYVSPRKEDKDKKPRTEVLGKPLIAFILFGLLVHWWANRGDVWQMEFALVEDKNDSAHSQADQNFMGSGVTKVTEDMFTSDLFGTGKYHLEMKAWRGWQRDDKDSNAVHFYQGTATVTGCHYCPKRHQLKFEAEVTVATMVAKVTLRDKRGSVWEGTFWLPGNAEFHDPDNKMREEDQPEGEQIAQGQK